MSPVSGRPRRLVVGGAQRLDPPTGVAFALPLAGAARPSRMLPRACQRCRLRALPAPRLRADFGL
eukprot:2597611-Pyramimonas_sp.AAC.1